MNRPAPPETISRLRGVLRVLAGGPTLFIHAKKTGRAEVESGRYGFFAALFETCSEMDVPVAFMPHGRGPYLARLGLPSVHLYFTFGRRPAARGVVFASPAYLNDYWYFDPKGHRSRSSVADAVFDPADIDPAEANAHFKRLRRRYVRGSETSRHQDNQPPGALPESFIAIALQHHKTEEERAEAICSEIELIDAVISARPDAPVVLKFHPAGARKETVDHVTRLAAENPRVHLSKANIHDVLDRARVLCCLNSAAGFEAMLHRTPAVLFAKSDFHHAAFTAADMDHVGEALDAAEASNLNYPKYLYWFMERHMLHPDQPGCKARIRAVIEAALKRP
ncbi:MAG: hypothetical protein AAFN79_17075 [Pseudomonadota bacterium]